MSSATMIRWVPKYWRWMCGSCPEFRGTLPKHASEHAWHVHHMIQRFGIINNRPAAYPPVVRPRVTRR